MRSSTHLLLGLVTVFSAGCVAYDKRGEIDQPATIIVNETIRESIRAGAEAAAVLWNLIDSRRHEKAGRSESASDSESEAQPMAESASATSPRATTARSRVDRASRVSPVTTTLQRGRGRIDRSREMAALRDRRRLVQRTVR